ncbi:MAG TPA: DUF1249 domain-containing protein [Steroidobacteraceae bacterium]|nr:DUF1249 domain-containing protein [Steroidobacteraceae bacterium]
MLSDALTAVSWRARPRSFAALMSLYESNYIRFGWLVGEVSALAGCIRSVVAADCDLLLTVVDRSPYTTTVNLTYLLAQATGECTYPDMGVRLYHDARLAEAQEWAGTHAHSGLKALRSRLERELDQRWARNVMLNKWLEYCVERGHRFSPAARISSPD